MSLILQQIKSKVGVRGINNSVNMMQTYKKGLLSIRMDNNRQVKDI